MSLSFVSSAVLSSTDGVSHNEEAKIDNAETRSVRESAKANGRQSLFEQLRANQDKEDEDHAALHKTMVRSTMALNEEDAAHLAALRQQEQSRLEETKTRTEQELALFRAQKQDRIQGEIVLEDDTKEEEEEGDEDEVNNGIVTKQAAAGKSGGVSMKQQQQKKKKAAPLVPKFVAKRKRKVATGGSNETTTTANKNPKTTKEPAKPAPAPAANTLGSLLGGYGSDDSDSD